MACSYSLLAWGKISVQSFVASCKHFFNFELITGIYRFIQVAIAEEWSESMK